jgi:O-antigen/teichoic acid export membrane protein
VLLVPLLVVNVLGAEANAYFYIAWMIANLLFSIPASMSYILFSEGSANNGAMKANIALNYKACFALLIPGITVVFLLGQWILGIFGAAYAENSVQLLRVLALSVLPLIVVDTQTAIYRVTKRMGRLIIVWGTIAAVTLAGGYMLMPVYGILGIGYAWLGANLVVLPFVWR